MRRTIEFYIAEFDRFIEDWLLERCAGLRAAGAVDEEIDRDLADCIAIWPEMRAAAIAEFKRGMLDG